MWYAQSLEKKPKSRIIFTLESFINLANMYMAHVLLLTWTKTWSSNNILETQIVSSDFKIQFTILRGNSQFHKSCNHGYKNKVLGVNKLSESKIFYTGVVQILCKHQGGERSAVSIHFFLTRGRGGLQEFLCKL